MAELRHASAEILEGWLFKRGKLGFSKKKKYVRLESQMLQVSTDVRDRAGASYCMNDAKIIGNPASLVMKMVIEGKPLTLIAQTKTDYESWYEAFKKAACSNVEEYYELGELLGEGAFAKVVLGVDRSTLEKCAVKIINKADTEQENEMDFIHRELRIMKTVNHPNLIRTHDIFDTKKELYIVMEYMPGGTLADAMKRKVLRTEKQVREVMREIIRGVQYLHAKHIVHRDLKLKNILCKNNEVPLEVKLADFGLSNFVGVRTMSRVKLVSQVGSPHYVAPEVLREMPYGSAVDMWSCGVILHIMLTGKYPFAGGTIKETLELVSFGNFQMQGSEWNHVSADAKDFIIKLLLENHKDRLTADQALEHPWLSGSS
mmetsp:Transcript_2491/g.7442  ORF Transcript_2491/g.7442 Transcript_2491/m.7442 type:complete len:373 (+) Transcript_2491:183-1301(+)